MTGNWTLVEKDNRHYGSLFEWVAYRPDLKDRTIDNSIKYLNNGDLIYFQYSSMFFIVTFDKERYKGLCTLMLCDNDFNIRLKAFSDKEILQNAEGLKIFLLEACDLFLARVVHNS